MRGEQERDKLGRLSGKAPVRYRMVFELDPPAIGRKKDPETGTNEIHRVELFTSEEHVLYWMAALLGRGGTKLPRAQAVILKDGEVTWVDKNIGEEE